MTIPVAGADYSSTVLGLNPVTYYRLNETTPTPTDAATNSSTLGAVLNGTYVGAVMHPSPGVFPNDDAAYFPSAGTVQIPWNAALNPPGAFTVECWANSAAADTATHTLVQSMIQGQNPANGNDRSGWNLREVGADLQYVIGTTTGAPFYYYFSAVGAVVPGVWQHLVAVYDGTNFSLFVNGAKQTLTVTRQDGVTPTPEEIAAVRVLTNFAGPTIIGDRGYTGWNFNGSIDEVAIYPTALSAATIAAHYNASSGSAAAYASLVLAANPIAYYRLDEPTFAPVYPTAVNSGSLAADANGTYQPGTSTLAAGPPYAGLGAGNYACQFDGVSGYIDCGFPPELDSYSGPISIMTWIHVNGWNKTWQAMVTKGDTAWRLHRNSAGGDTRFVGFGTSGLSNVDQAGTRVVDDGFWHHIVAVYDGSAKYIYVDGTLDVATPVTGALAVNSQPIFIGENAGATGRFFSGLMDEVAIFTNGLTASQVLQVYNAAQVPPIITQIQRTPADPLYEGYNISMTAAALGALPLTNHWYKNNGLLTNQTSLTFSIPNAAVADSGNYMLVVANAYGSTTSAVQVVTVSAGPPIILSQSITNASRAIGGHVTYSVVAGGSAPINYQWNHNSTPILGATSSVLKLTNLQLADQGAYTVTLTNPYGTNNNSATGVVSVVTVTNYPFASMYGNPLAYYRLNETTGTTAAEIAGGLPGTIINSPVLGVDGPRPPTWLGLESTNTAFQFNGSSTRVQLPPFNLQTNQMTIVAWINPAGPQSDQTGIVSTRNGNDVGGLFLNYNNNNALSYVWAGSSSWSTFQSGLFPVEGQWNFVALVIEPNVGTVYLDSGSGLQSASYSGANQTAVWSNPNIGVDPGYNRFFNGSIDEVIVYDRALSPAEIGNLDYNAINGPKGPTFVQQPASRTAYASGAAKFSAQVNGYLPLVYRWEHATTNLPGATSATLILTNLSSANAGSYVLAVTNPVGNASSTSATLTVLTPTPGTYAASVVGNSPLGYWPLNEPLGSTTAFDLFGMSDANVEPGVAMGVVGVRPPDFRGFGVNNLAAQFDGFTPASVSIPPQNLYTNSFTFTLWLQRNGDQATRAGIIHQRMGSTVLATGLGFQDSPNNNQLSYNWNDDGNAYGWNPGFTPPDGQWTFVAVSVTPTNATLYMGTPSGLVSAVNSLAHAPHDFSRAPIEIGRDNYQASRVFNGQIDEVALYAHALSPDQIATLFASGKYAPTDPVQITQQPVSQDVLVGDSAAFDILAVGGVPWTYQWQHDGVDIAGATTGTYAIPSTYYTDAGSYRAVVHNVSGSVTSVVATLTVNATPTFANLTNGMVLHLKFDGNYLDSSGRHNDGTQAGSPGFVAGKIGSGALQYSTVVSGGGVSAANYVTLGTPADLQLGSNVNFSVAFWIKFTGLPGDLPFLANNLNSMGDPGVTIAPSYKEGGWSWGLNDALNPRPWPGIGLYDPVGNTLNDGTWHHLVHTFDREGNATTYLDGVRVHQMSILPAVGWDLDTGHPWNIGQASGSYAEAGVFQMDDLGIWRRALTQAEAESIYVVGQDYGRSFDTYGPVMVSVNRDGTNIDVVWQAGMLLQSTNVVGGYSPVTGATAPFYRTSPTNTATFYRVQQ